MPSLRLIPKGEKRFPFPPGMVIRVSEVTRTLGGANMRKKSSNQPNQWGATVTPIRQAEPQIEPPEGDFEPTSAFGFMAFKEGNEGRLVRLAEVLRWIEHSKSLPRLAALNLLCVGLQPDAMQWLYWLRDTDYATPVPADFMFGLKSLAQVEEERAEYAEVNLREPWNLSKYSNPPLSEAIEPGVPALLKLLQTYWTSKKFNAVAKDEVLDDPRFKQLTPLAIRLDKAFEIWGYGRVLSATEGAEKTASAATDTSAEWTDQRIYNRRTGLGKTPKAMVVLLEEMGLEVNEANKRNVRHIVTKVQKQKEAAIKAGSIGAMAGDLSRDKKTVKKA